jgi:maltokinase
LASLESGPTLLDDLRTAWPPDEGPVTGGYVRPVLAEARPVAAAPLRPGRARGLGVVVAERHDGRLLLAPLVREDGAWRRARPRDGASTALIDALRLAEDLGPGFRLRRLGEVGAVRGERAIGVDQTNESVVVGTSAVVKWIAEPAPRDPAVPDLQAHLAALGYRGVPAPIGTLEWTDDRGRMATLALVATWLPDAADGWDWCVADVLGHVLHLPDGCDGACDGLLLARRLGTAAAGLAVALATPSDVIPQPVGWAGRERIDAWHSSAMAALDDALATLEGDALQALEQRSDAMRARIATIRSVDTTPVTWVHGDLHVGQVLRSPTGLSIIDLDDDVSLPLGERGQRLSPVRDMAQLASSLDHVGRIVDRRTSGEVSATVDAWVDQARTSFLGAYVSTLTAAGQQGLWDDRLLTGFEAERVCRELLYAARTLPRWMYAPLGTLRRMIPT